jgi:hypothetical protein
MGLRTFVVVVGSLLVVVSQLGVPGLAATELAPQSPSSEIDNLCEVAAPNEILAEPEALLAEPDTAVAESETAVPASFLPDPPLFSLLEKQPDEQDGSVVLFAQELAPTAVPSPGTLVASLPTAADPSQEVMPPPAAPVTPRYKVDDNNDVRRFLDQFQTGYRRAVIERWLVRAGRYLPMLLDVFKQKGLPEELVFTAMIESGFDPLAASRAGAKGLWQFMAPTARRYGLRVDTWLDERLDPEKSTLAAARHFLDLYAVFGSWNLVQAAYNAGERTVLEAIRAMGTSDFWALTRGRWLKDETKNFIPAIQAATMIAREPQRYGFTVTPAEPLAYELVSVPGSTGLKQLASASRLDVETLERLNPELRLKQTPPGGPYSLKVPVGSSALLREGLNHEPAIHSTSPAPHHYSGTGASLPAPRSPMPTVHTVKRQETVSVIAQRYGVSVTDIIRWNGLGDAARIRPGDKLRVASAGGRVETTSRSQ